MRRLVCLFALWALPAASQGTPAKARPDDYPAHARAGALGIGAEYTVHSFFGRGLTFVAPGYLTVEVALFPAPGETVKVSAGAFSLRVNGKKQPLLAQYPSMVAASLKYPDWESRPRLEAGGGMGDVGIIIGRPEPVERFPGDPQARRRPAPPRAPEPENRSGTERPPAPSAAEIAVESALPEGPARAPVAGFLYFPFRGKIKSIKSLHLLYSGPEGEAVVTLYERPGAKR